MKYVFSQLSTPEHLEVPVPTAGVVKVLLKQQVNHSNLQYGILRLIDTHFNAPNCDVTHKSSYQK